MVLTHSGTVVKSVGNAKTALEKRQQLTGMVANQGIVVEPEEDA